MIDFERCKHLLVLLDGTSEVHFAMEHHRWRDRRTQVLQWRAVPEHVDALLRRFSAERQLVGPVEVAGAAQADEIADAALCRRSGEAVRMTDNPVGQVTCLLYTSDAADDLLCVDLGGRRIIKKK